MGRSLGWKIALILSISFYAACTGKSPAAPTPQPGPPPTPGTAAAIFLSPDTWDLPAGGGALEIIIRTAANEVGNVPAPHVAIALTASSGTLSDTAPQTDSTGHARVTWTGTSSASITARVGEVVGTSTIRVATPPTSTPIPTPTPGPSPGPETPPQASGLLVDIFPSPRGGDAVTPITFTTRVRTTDGTPTGALTYAWDFETDGTVDSTAANPTHLFRPADHWTVTVKVTSADGRTGSSQVNVVIGASPAPLVTVTATASRGSGIIGDTFTFSATSTSNSSAGAVTSYSWNFGAGATPAGSTGAAATATYATPGVKTVRVTATTANGTTDADQLTVRVLDHPITVTLNASTPRVVGTTVTFTATVQSSGTAPAGATYSWDFDGGTSTTTTNTAGFTYNTPGQKTISVTVTPPASDGRAPATATMTITVL